MSNLIGQRFGRLVVIADAGTKEIEVVTHTECGGVNAIVENTRIWQRET